MISAMNRARLFGEQRRSAVLDPQTVRWAAPGCNRGDMLRAGHYERYGLYGITSGSVDGSMRLSPGQNGPEAVRLAI